jgi:hypothetical protein
MNFWAAVASKPLPAQTVKLLNSTLLVINGLKVFAWNTHCIYKRDLSPSLEISQWNIFLRSPADKALIPVTEIKNHHRSVVVRKENAK